MLAAQLLGNTLDEALNMLRIDSIASEINAPSAPTLCGLEMALLDALGKTKRCTVSILLSPIDTKPRPGIAVNAVVGARSVEAVVVDARKAIAAGFGCLKLKVGLETEVQGEIDRIAAVRQATGPDVHLRLDANEAWTLEQAIAILSRCAQFDIQYVEQPLIASNLAGMRILRQAVPIPIAADEAFSNIESAHRILDSEAADILVIKPQLVGGLRAGQQIIQAAADRGVQSVITSSIEAGIGVAAALHLAAASPLITLECGLATLHLLVDDLLVDELAPHNGFLTVPPGPGLGIQLDRQALDRCSS
jgi:o-succinylbenzoate synthase